MPSTRRRQQQSLHSRQMPMLFVAVAVPWRCLGQRRRTHGRHAALVGANQTRGLANTRRRHRCHPRRCSSLPACLGRRRHSGHWGAGHRCVVLCRPSRHCRRSWCKTPRLQCCQTPGWLASEAVSRSSDACSMTFACASTHRSAGAFKTAFFIRARVLADLFEKRSFKQRRARRGSIRGGRGCRRGCCEWRRGG